MTSREFAKLIGVSQATVSRAINNSELVTPETKQYILQKAREYGFALNSQARSLRTQKTETIGILFPKHFVGMTYNPMLAYLYDCIQQELRKYNYDIMVLCYEQDENYTSNLERIIRMHKVDGFLVMKMELTDDEAALIEEYKVPCVFIMNAGAVIRNNLNYIFSDSEYGGYLAGKYFGRFDDCRYLFATVREEREDAKRRLAGFRRGLAEYGKTFADEDILYCNLSIESAYRCVKHHADLFFDSRTALFSYSDILARGIVNGLQEIGVQIPEQTQIISMDDIPLASWLKPELSTIHVDVERMIPSCCKLLVDSINNIQSTVQIWLKPSLVLRDTTRKLPERQDG